MPGYDYLNTNRENYIANMNSGIMSAADDNTTYSGMPTYNPMNPYSDGNPSFVYESNPGAVQGDFRYEGVNPALNPNASPDDYKVFDRPSMNQGLGMYYDANVDPSDWRVIQQIMGAGGNPDDYIETADSYAPVNLIQMLMDAQDAGDDDLIELLQGDLEMMYPSLV
tara:strand:+ start:847 stop:1347 length:501 start_codon:yes stop_codon:yes gene_type:complete